ncbi:MAG: glucose-1-phosphate adenylyltransferase subunit GlgD [Ruminococcus sp.]|nr:glucose-1-phosphate adenylyltransferase subunit GlgD [Ruminococcus sp.]
MSVAGIIFTTLHHGGVSEIMGRSVAAVPFMCRYRLVDFPLSNMVNSNITNVALLANNNYHSLIEHIGSGKDWDLARRSGGLTILPPYSNSFISNTRLVNPRLAELKNVYESLDFKEDYVVLADCDMISNMDYNCIVNEHIASGADITIGVREMYVTPEIGKHNVIYEADESGRITDISVSPTNITGRKYVGMNVTVMKTEYLRAVIADSIAHNYDSFSLDVIARNLDRRNFRVYKYDGFVLDITNFDEYYAASMDMISNSEHRNAIFNVANNPILTRVRNSPPTRHVNGSKVVNSLIADGCEIEGTVENSILFRGVKVGKNTVVKNSILFKDVYTGEDVVLNCVVADKNVVIRDKKVLSGHETMPFYIPRDKMI